MTLDELIMTRVSHDLAGICGALYNTAELLEIDETFGSDAGPLMKSSAATLMARLKFFRALFGLDGAPVDNEIAYKYLQTLSAPFELTGEVCHRAHLAGILICADMMIRGGKIEVNKTSVCGVGNIKLSEQLPLVLNGQLNDIEPKMAPAAWLYAYGKRKHRLIETLISSDRLDIRF